MDKYLLNILLEVNTIIIPGLGALTVTNKKTGEIMFMPYLKHDDGNLARHIAEKEGISENDAKNLVAKYVREIHAKLDIGDTYDMYKFGRFLKVDGDVDFENWDKYQHSEEEVANDHEKKSMIEVPIVEEKTEEPTIETNEEIVEIPPINEENKVVEPEIEIETQKENIDLPYENVEVPSTNLEKEEIAPIIEEKDENQEIKEANSVIEDLLSASTPVEQNSSLDEILGEKTSPEIQQEVKKDEVASPKIDTSQILPQENVYIPKEEVKEIVEKQKSEEPKIAKEKTNNQVKVVVKKKKSKAFWILSILGILLLVGGTLTIIFMDDLKAKFSEDKNLLVKSEKSSESDENLEQIEQQVELENQELEKEQENSKKEKEVAVSESNSSGELNYHIIIGSFSVEANATRLANKKQAESPKAKVLGEVNNMFLVSYDSFGSKAEAQEALKKYSFSAWVLKFPN